MISFGGGGGSFLRGRRRRLNKEAAKRVSLHEPLPPEVAGLARQAGMKDEAVTVPADIGPDGRLVDRWLVADPERVVVIGPNGGGPEVQLDVPLREVQEFKLDRLIGSGALTATIDGDEVELVRYTNAEALRYSKVCKRLGAWAKGQTAEDEADDDAPSDDRDKRRQTILRLFGYIRPYWRVIALMLSLVAVSRFLSILGPQFFGLLTDRVFVTGQQTANSEAGGMVAWLFPLQSSPRVLLNWVLVAMLVSQLLSALINIAEGRITAWFGYKITHDVRRELYSHLQSLSLGYFDQRQTGAVISRVTNDTRSLQGFLVSGATGLISNLLLFIIIGSVLLSMNWQLTLISLLPIPITTFLATAFRKKIRRYYGRLWQRWERLTATLQDSLSGVRVVKAFSGERREVVRFEGDSSRVADAGADANKLRATISPLLMWAVGLSGAAIWYFGGIRILAGEMTVGMIMQFYAYLMMFIGPVQWFSDLFNWLQETLAGAERIWEVMDEKPKVPEPTDPKPLGVPQGHFVFEDVTFGYEPHQPVLRDLNLEVQPGEMIGLVGHSGAGKSTMINLICRFYDVDEGRILIDGQDLRDVPSAEYRHYLGVVLQDSFLFNGTILENIAYGKPEASVEEVIAAAKAANAHDFITELPDGYDTIVGERGHRLSGGERQRVSIARAVLHNPRILILDEATASVDTETERQIQEALERLVEGRTTFAIAHRLSTLRNADRLVVIDHGTIAEIGTHDELMNKEDGVFRKLVEMQSQLHQLSYVGG